VVLVLGRSFRLRKFAVVLCGAVLVQKVLLWFRVANWENRGGGQAGSSISECLYL
jgi:hypothetical protein